jgi:hypothetical protein
MLAVCSRVSLPKTGLAQPERPFFTSARWLGLPWPTRATERWIVVRAPDVGRPSQFQKPSNVAEPGSQQAIGLLVRDEVVFQGTILGAESLRGAFCLFQMPRQFQFLVMEGREPTVARGDGVDRLENLYGTVALSGRITWEAAIFAAKAVGRPKSRPGASERTGARQKRFLPWVSMPCWPIASAPEPRPTRPSARKPAR